MNEEQLGQLAEIASKNQGIVSPGKECGFICQHEKEIKEGVEWGEWVLVGLAVGFIAVVVGLYLWNKYSQNQKEIKKIKSQIESLKTGQ